MLNLLSELFSEILFLTVFVYSRLDTLQNVLVIYVYNENILYIAVFLRYCML